MTEKRRRRSLRQTLTIVAATAGIGFIGLFGGLASQMAASRDPALGPKATAIQAHAYQPVQRRIIKRTVVVRKIHDPAPASAPAAAAAPVRATSPAPVVVQAPPAPAPAPAPVVTKVS
jgi:hypothetical protein